MKLIKFIRSQMFKHDIQKKADRAIKLSKPIIENEKTEIAVRMSMVGRRRLICGWVDQKTGRPIYVLQKLCVKPYGISLLKSSFDWNDEEYGDREWAQYVADRFNIKMLEGNK